MQASTETIRDLLDALESSGSRTICLEGCQIVQQALACVAVTRMVISLTPILRSAGIPLFGNLIQPID